MEKISASYFDIIQELKKNGLNFEEHWVIGEGARKMNGVSVPCFWNSELKTQIVKDILKEYSVDVEFYANSNHIYITLKN
jgi:hypothetical protein